MRILITGGAGFVGSNLALAFKRDDPTIEVVAFDNLKRRGSEFNLASFKRHGIEFVHGDVRVPSDLDDLHGNFDVLIEASAEPSVQAGMGGSPQYILQTNLTGTMHCLEFARKRTDSLVFLSTSRVYSIAPLRAINLTETSSRFEIADAQSQPGVSRNGIAETFPTHLPRSFYGATKLASEMLIQEYVHAYGMKAIINRCGVIAGAGQFGKSDQGVFTFWVARHHFGRPLKYTGFGGSGKQVRDLLHPSDLYRLLKRQLAGVGEHSGEIFNVGGGREVSTSLCELTATCQEVLGRRVHVGEDPETSPVDVPLYISDHNRVSESFAWQPERSVKGIVEDIARWIKENEAQLKSIFN